MILELFRGGWGIIVDSIEVSDIVSKGVGIEKRGRMRGFSMQTIGSNTNLKNRVVHKEYIHSLRLLSSL